MPENAAKYYTDLQLELLDTRDTAAATDTRDTAAATDTRDTATATDTRDTATATDRSSDDKDDKIMDYQI